jgi:hypothetical protein
MAAMMRSQHWATGVLLVMVFVLVGGCSQLAQRGLSDKSAVPTAPAEVAMEYDGAEGERAMADAPAGGADEQAVSADASTTGVTRRIIKTGEMSVEVQALSDVLDRARTLAEEAGGYIADTSVDEDSEGRRSGNITVRIPAEEFDEIFAALQQLGKTLHFSESAQDVTEEWVDLEARISNKKAEEDSLLKLLERKGELSDILDIQRETFRVRGEIEQLEGRLRYLKNQVSLSTITVYLTEPGEAAVAEPGGWRLGYHVRTAWNMLGRIIEAVAYFIIYVVIAGAVVWVPIALLVWWLVRRARRKRAAAAGDTGGPQTPGEPEVDADA